MDSQVALLEAVLTGESGVTFVVVPVERNFFSFFLFHLLFSENILRQNLFKLSLKCLRVFLVLESLLILEGVLETLEPSLTI